MKAGIDLGVMNPTIFNKGKKMAKNKHFNEINYITIVKAYGCL